MPCARRSATREWACRRRDFAFETTLAGRGYARCVRNLGPSGYRTHLLFLSLPSADLAVARVAERVRQGGHDVPAAVIRRRFISGLRNLFSTYLSAVDDWDVYDNSELSGPRLIASGGGGIATTLADGRTFRHLQDV